MAPGLVTLLRIGSSTPNLVGRLADILRPIAEFQHKIGVPVTCDSEQIWATRLRFTAAEYRWLIAEGTVTRTDGSTYEGKKNRNPSGIRHLMSDAWHKASPGQDLSNLAEDYNLTTLILSMRVRPWEEYMETFYGLLMLDENSRLRKWVRRASKVLSIPENQVFTGWMTYHGRGLVPITRDAPSNVLKVMAAIRICEGHRKIALNRTNFHCTWTTAANYYVLATLKDSTNVGKWDTLRPLEKWANCLGQGGDRRYMEASVQVYQKWLLRTKEVEGAAEACPQS